MASLTKTKLKEKVRSIVGSTVVAAEFEHGDNGEHIYTLKLNNGMIVTVSDIDDHSSITDEEGLQIEWMDLSDTVKV